MPKTKRKYSQVISAAITEELYARIVEETKTSGCSLSTVVREALDDYYNIEYPDTYIIRVKGDDLRNLKDLGFFVTKQE